MTQFTQRFIAALLVVLLFGAVMPTHAAAAANTSDKPVSFSISDTRKRTGYRRKYNSTPVYVYYTVGKYSRLRASAYGWMDTDDADLAAFRRNRTRCNGSYVDYVYVKKMLRLPFGLICTKQNAIWMCILRCNHIMHEQQTQFLAFGAQTAHESIQMQRHSKAGNARIPRKEYHMDPKGNNILLIQILLALFLCGILCGCSTYTSNLTQSLVPNPEDFIDVDHTESVDQTSTDTGSSNYTNESPPSDMWTDTGAIAQVCLPTAAVSMGSSINLNSDYSDISGVLCCTIDEATVYNNLYDAGFSENQIDCFGDPAFPYRGSITFDEDAFDKTSGNFRANIGLLRIRITITNDDAKSTVSERDYGDPYLFDIREFFLADFSLTNRFDPNEMLCSSPVAFSSYQLQPEGRFLYRLASGESETYYIGYLVDLETFDWDKAFLCNCSMFVVPEEIEDIAFYSICLGSDDGGYNTHDFDH